MVATTIEYAGVVPFRPPPLFIRGSECSTRFKQAVSSPLKRSSLSSHSKRLVRRSLQRIPAWHSASGQVRSRRTCSSRHQTCRVRQGTRFYVALNKLLAEAKFDAYVEGLCEPLCRDGGRPGIPPGVFFRMLFVGYFEGIDSQRGIAWRCSDSMSLRSFLGLLPTESSPDHSSLTVIRKRMPNELIEQVFAFVLKMAFDKKLVRGKTVAVDSTTLEANAAMRSIVRRDTGDSWKQYLTKLAKETGIEEPTDAQLWRFDRKRKGKKTSNDDWKSPTDPDSRITKMKDGTTHLAYKAEHAVDLETNIVIAATIQPGNAADSETVKETVIEAQGNLNYATEQECVIAEIVADKG